MTNRKNNKPSADPMASLRQEAEKRLRLDTSGLDSLSAMEVKTLVHELRPHQIELEMQNEELRKAQNELEESRRKYSDLYDLAPVGYFTFDKNGLILDMNLTGATQTGRPRNQLKGTPFSRLIREEHRPIFCQHLQEVFSQGTRRTCELAVCGREGEEFFGRLETIAVQDQGGAMGSCLTTLSDITEKKLAEEKLRYASWYARNLIEASIDPLVVISEEGKISDINRATELATGYEREAIVGTDFSAYFTDPLKAKKGYQMVFRKGIVKDYPLEIRHKDGGITPVLYNASLFSDEKGKIMGAFAAARQLDAILQVSEKKLRAITSAIGEGIIVVDEKGRLTFMNPEAERLLGWTEKELLHKEIHSVIHHTGVKSLSRPEDCPILGIYSTGAVYRTWDDVFRTKDGALLPVAYISSPVLSDGKVVAIITAFQDITERKAMEQKLMSYTEALEISNKELEQFAYVASHDLQEPLRKIASFTELLEQKYKGALDEKADMYIHFIVDGATRMNTLINDLLTYCRVSTRAKEFSPTDLSEVLSQVVKDLSLTVEESNASLTSDRLPTVMADDTQIGQVLQNLISNALKFRGQEPLVIHISAENIPDFLTRRGDLPADVTRHLTAMQRGWVISVKDNGIGIEPRYFERIFQIFQRLHTQEEYPGTGIGLAVCKKVVERHGGMIWVESETGKGTTFYFTIPER
ncbi:MAG: PAS domain S-box protein [Nitrospirales bacterium]|nr:PAS domain S-box protein [Nitrospirales bacterium]